MKGTFRKAYVAISIFFAAMAISLAICMSVNGATPVLHNGDNIPADAPLGEYTLSGVEYLDDAGSYIIHLLLPERIPEGITLKLADMTPFTASLDGEEVFSYREDDVYRRVIQFTLQPSLLEGKRHMRLTITSDSTSDKPREIISRGLMSPTKILIGWESAARSSQMAVWGVITLAIGMHIILVIESLVLFTRKRTEKYLLVFSLVSLFSLFSLACSASNPILNISHGFYSMIKPMNAIAPVLMNVCVCLFLLIDYTPRRVRPFISFPVIIAVAVFLMLLRALSNYSFYSFVRWLLLPLVIYTLCAAWRDGAPDALALILGYAIDEGMVMSLFLVNTLGLRNAGNFLACIPVDQFGYMIYLLFCMLVINRRFADKYVESERLSAQLRDINLQLDDLVEKRTLQLREEQNRKHNLMLNIFHDIRSPLFILHENLKLLSTSKDDEAMKRSLCEKTLYLQRLTGDLFMLAKLESDAILFEEDNVDLARLINALVSENQQNARLGNIELSLTGGESPCMVWADAARLQQLYQNLLDNAFIHTPSFGKISVSLTREDGQAVCRITDTGAGIPQDDIPKIFTRYYSTGRNGRGKSSGLGLSIAREIAKRHRGQIGAESAVGRGTTIWVSLPLLDG
ncbi:MAG: ATP-binding protein [Clostridia bacterium]|nr:ATP-binding protein [Clostridia bacterium]